MNGLLGVNLNQQSTTTGMSAEALGWFYGFVLIAMLTVLLAGVGALINKAAVVPMLGLGAFLGVSGSIGFGLWPLYTIVLLVLILAAVVAYFKR